MGTVQHGHSMADPCARPHGTPIHGIGLCPTPPPPLRRADGPPQGNRSVSIALERSRLASTLP
eukprot:6299239-Alexandrium_andersonii.AAC.1